jgi:hypothetical protein
MKRKFQQVMVNNSTDINKTSNDLSFFKLLNKEMYEVGNPGPCLGQTQSSGVVKWVNGISTMPP